jgi:SAM-dependent methyltransferase
MAETHDVHRVAAIGFSAQADAYDRARPGYPPDAVSWLASVLRIEPGRIVVDLAAGTGKLTALIAPEGATLIAVEPVTAMRDRLRANLPGIPVLAGVAEALPFADCSVDAVVVAQAFHWFDADLALAELARVIRPGGRLGLIWNARDRSVPWVDSVWTVMDAVERNAPWRDHRDGTGPAGQAAGAYRRSGPPAVAAGSWSPWTEATFFHVQHSTHEQVVDRMLSVSHIAALPAGEQRKVLGEIAAILATHPDTAGRDTVTIPYRVDVMHAGRLA